MRSSTSSIPTEIRTRPGVMPRRWRSATGTEACVIVSGCERSEEHTSELQSPCNLVCRLLLEKKKNPADDMVGPGLVGWVEVSGFSRRFEGSHHDPGGIWTQVPDLSVQELAFRPVVPLGSLEV